jgi:regulator of protease activity HflC (stomatin/prohibitin superfamily)
MTLHQSDINSAHLAALPHFTDAYRVSRPLMIAVSVYVAGIAVLLAAACNVGPAAWQPGFSLLHRTGAVGAVLSAITLALGATLSCLVMVGVRRRAVAPADRPRRSAGAERSRQRANWRPGWLQRSGGPGGVRAQALLLIAAAASAVAALFLFGAHDATDTLPATASWFVLAGASALAAFPLLVAERIIGAIPPASFPEQSWLRPFAVLPLTCLALGAAADVAQGIGLNLAYPVVLLLGIGLAIVSIERGVRGGIVFVLPLPERAEARAPINSLVLRLLQPGLGGGTSWSSTMRDRFGIDFARSWALRYLRRATAPVAVGLAVLCIFLTGVVRIDSNERGIYQRLGRPVAVLQPGLHLILPWPLGQVRRTEYGVVHAVPISYGDAKVPTDAFLNALASATTTSGVDGPAPASANRLWDADQPSDVSYIISSDSRGRQSFETISVSMRVLWRIGLDDASARAAAYTLIDQDKVVRTLASQLLARYLASRTLAQLLGEDRISITSSLQTGLQQMLDRLGAGMQVVSVIVEAIHPPGGAAAAYRSVQAAEIAANTEIAVEQGRAEITAGLARRDAAATIATATAAAAERLSAARIVRTNQQVDAAAYRNNSAAFELDLYLAQLSSVLPRATVEIVDHRIGLPDGPTLDLRPFGQTGDTTALPAERTTKLGDSPQ